MNREGTHIGVRALVDDRLTGRVRMDMDGTAPWGGEMSARHARDLGRALMRAADEAEREAKRLRRARAREE